MTRRPLPWKVRQAIGLKRASYKRNVSSLQAQRMQDRAEKLLREADRDKERIARMKRSRNTT